MPWLPCCLASVRDQVSEGLAVEHIVHDGGSTDGSLEILQAAPNLQWSGGPDDGMYDAINRCWKQASGDICCYLNADEQYLPGVLEKVAEQFNAEPELEMLLGDALLVGQEGTILSYRRVVVPTAAHTRLVHLASMSCSMFFRKNLLDGGFYFDTRWRAIGDAEWVWRLLRRGLRVRTLGEPLAAFGITGGNLGGGEKARAEADKWRNEAGRQLPGTLLALKVWHWLRKARAGAYRKHSVDTHLWLPGKGHNRIAITNPAVGHRWIA